MMLGGQGQQSLCFCVEYASACHLPLKETPLLLRLEGSDIQFPATLSVLRYNGGRRIYGGWRGLVSQAGMEAGDICLVELVDRSSERLTMTVYLICKSEMQL
uniref:TF-B3 domain-containing protein n=1 Tax=Aegilops tauschii subsp. strangulata TaxID=200361 RepID=A0A453R6K0_AEGTS